MIYLKYLKQESISLKVRSDECEANLVYADLTTAVYLQSLFAGHKEEGAFA